MHVHIYEFAAKTHIYGFERMNRYLVCKERSLSLLCDEDGKAKEGCLDNDVRTYVLLSCACI